MRRHRLVGDPGGPRSSQVLIWPAESGKCGNQRWPFSRSLVGDQEGVVRHAVINDPPLGRDVDEAVRMLDALQFTEKHGEVCPATWKAGDEGMKPTAEGVAGYLARRA